MSSEILIVDDNADIRNIINEPISFPDTTGCSSPTIGGTLIKFK